MWRCRCKGIGRDRKGDTENVGEWYRRKGDGEEERKRQEKVGVGW